MKKLCLVVILASIVLGLGLIISLDQNYRKDKRIQNLLSQNNEWAEKVTSLEQEKNDLEDFVQKVKDEKLGVEGELYQSRWFIKKLATHLPSATVVNEAASIAVNGDGRKDIDILATIFYVGGEETSAWSNAEEKKLGNIAGKIFSAKQVVVK